MTEGAENIVLEMLKGLRNDVAALRTEMHDQFGNLKQHMLAIERGIGGSSVTPRRYTRVTPGSRRLSTS